MHDDRTEDSGLIRRRLWMLLLIVGTVFVNKLKDKSTAQYN